MLARRVIALVAGAAVLSGCGVSTRNASAEQAARAFADAVAAGDGATACSLLTDEARSSTETFGRDCAGQLAQLGTDPGAVQHVEVWSDAAQVVFTGDTVFLLQFPDGWRVSAAGCTPRPEQPYECEVEG